MPAVRGLAGLATPGLCPSSLAAFPSGAREAEDSTTRPGVIWGQATWEGTFGAQEGGDSCPQGRGPSLSQRLGPQCH